MPKQILNICNECMIYKKKYAGKLETSFNLRPNKHRKDANNLNSLQADQRFQLPDHNFSRHAKSTLTGKLNIQATTDI